MSTISTGTSLTTAFVINGDTTGELVVKTGAGASTALTLSATGTLSLATGNLTFSSTAQRITGDFTNATASNRLLFQTSTTNGNSFVGNMPNGTGSYGAYISYNGSDPANSSSFLQGITSTDARLVSTAAGTGSLLPLTFYTGGSERMRLDTSGNLLLNTGSAGFNAAGLPLVVGSGSGNTGMTIFSGTAGVGSIHFGDTVTTGADGYRGFLNYNHSTNAMQLGTDATARMTIDSSGNVGIGAGAAAFDKVMIGGTLPSSSAVSIGFSNRGTIPSTSTTSAYGFNTALATQAASFTTTALYHYFAGGPTLGAGSAISNQFGFYVQSTLTNAANNYGFFSDIAAASSRWNFYAAGTAQNYFAGNVFIGSPSNLGVGVRVAVSYEGGGTQYGLHFRPVNDTTTPIWFSNASGTGVGSISQNTTNTAYNTSSDRRLKENIVPADAAAAVIDSIQIVKHDWKVGGHTRYGVIAQDLYEIVPEAVAKGDDGDEIEKTWGVDYSKLVPILVKAMQEQQEQIKALQDKVAALEIK